MTSDRSAGYPRSHCRKVQAWIAPQTRTGHFLYMMMDPEATQLVSRHVSGFGGLPHRSVGRALGMQRLDLLSNRLEVVSRDFSRDGVAWL